MVAGPETAAACMGRLLAQPDAAVIVVTRELAAALPPGLRQPAADRPGPVIVEIPGIDDAQGFAGDELARLAAVLGVPL
jgi:vacuolar-type H+-ATPase subunit F/Vma7